MVQLCGNTHSHVGDCREPSDHLSMLIERPNRLAHPAGELACLACLCYRWWCGIARGRLPWGVPLRLYRCTTCVHTCFRCLWQTPRLARRRPRDARTSHRRDTARDGDRPWPILPTCTSIPNIACSTASHASSG